MTRFKDFFKGDDDGSTPPKKQKQKLYWLLGAAALGISLIMLGSGGESKNDVAPQGAAPTQQEAGSQNRSPMAREEEALANKLKGMLTKIEGAGQVEVTVRLASSSQSDYAINTSTGRKTTEEKDQSGGTRTIEENTDSGQLVLIRDGQGETPVMEQEKAAQVAGVLVVAEGANQPQVKARLFQATRVSLGVEPQKIMIMPRERGES